MTITKQILTYESVERLSFTVPPSYTHYYGYGNTFSTLYLINQYGLLFKLTTDRSRDRAASCCVVAEFACLIFSVGFLFIRSFSFAISLIIRPPISEQNLYWLQRESNRNESKIS